MQQRPASRSIKVMLRKEQLKLALGKKMKEKFKKSPTPIIMEESKDIYERDD